MKKLILGMIFLILAVPMVHAVGSNLQIDNLDVKVDDRWSRNVDNGETISREAEPGSSVDFKIKFKNNFTEAEDLKIEDVTATVTIEEIDDGEDIDEESNEFDIRANDDKSVTLSFKVPVEVDEDTFDVKIEADGEDENGTEQSVVWTVFLEVKKEDHELRFYKAFLSPAEVKAGSSASLILGIMNTGAEDEEDIELTISNTDLGYNNVVKIAELTAEPFEDESKFQKTFKINVPKDAESGIYPLSLRVTYDDGDEVLDESVDLTVVEAEEEAAPITAEEEIKELEEREEVVVIEPTTPPTGAAVVTEPIVPPVVTEEKSFFERGVGSIGLLIGAEIIVIVIAILLVIALVRRKSE